MNLPVTHTVADASVDQRFGSVDCVFFVIGAQKAGTTWLNRYLREHPNVSVPYWKENNYWNMVDGKPDPGRMLLAQKARRKNENILRKLVATLGFTMHAKRQRAITLALRAADAPTPPFNAYADIILENKTPKTLAAGEVCPEYAILKPETFAQMARLSPNVRFIYLMRDPVSRFISGMRHSLRKKHGKQKITEAALSEALTTYAARPLSRPMILSRYDKTIAALETHVPCDQILYVFFEQMFDQAQVSRICTFLGIPPVQAQIARKRNVAGQKAAIVRAEDRKIIAKALGPVYAFARERFGADLPKKWKESARLC